MGVTLALKVKERTPLTRRVAHLLREVEIEQDLLEEIFLLLLSKKSRATERDIREISDFLEEEAWKEIERRLQS